MAFKVTLSEIPSLIKALDKWKPVSLQIYYMIKNSHKTNNVWPRIDVYVDNTELEKLTSVVAVWHLNSQRKERWYVCFTREQENLKAMIRIPGVVDVRQGERIAFNCQHPAMDVVADFLKEMGMEPHVVGPAYSYILDKTEFPDLAASEDISATFRIAPLEVRHASLLHDAWRYGTPQALDFYENTIKHQQTLAIFKDNGQPVSWVIAKEWGDIGLTYTSPDFQRRGFASILTATLAKMRLENNETPFATVEEGNEASIALHTKLGFNKINTFDSWFVVK